MGVQRLCRPVPIGVPHTLEDVVTTMDDTRCLGKVSKQIELLRRQCDVLVRESNGSGGEIDDETIHLEPLALGKR